MELVIDYEFLKGINDEVVIKEVCLVADNIVQTFHIASPYKMAPHATWNMVLIGRMSTYILTYSMEQGPS
jgi:hypothetical protein